MGTENCSRNDIKTANILYDLIPFTWHPEMCVTSQYYWTENHDFQYGQAECILGELLGKDVSEIQGKLISLLEFKRRCGMAEFLSPNYIPHTFKALLNIFDFTTNHILRNATKQVLDRICDEISKVSISPQLFITPTARDYYGRRGPKTEGLAIDLCNFVNGWGVKPDSFFAKTKYIWTKQGPDDLDEIIQVSPTQKQLQTYLQEVDNLEDRTVIQWSHGGYWSGSSYDWFTMYDRYNLWAHKSWWFLSLIPAPGTIRSIFNTSFLNGFPLTDQHPHLPNQTSVSRIS